MQSDQLTLFAGDTLASHSALPGSERAIRMTVTSGQKYSGLSENCSPIGLLEKTLLATYPWASTKCYLTWKARATPQGRLLFQLAPSMPRTDAIGSGLLPTPNASDNRNRGDVSMSSVKRRIRIGKQVGLSMLFKGTPCPMCVESIMGFPENWTSLD